MGYLRVASIAALSIVALTCQAFSDEKIVFFSDREEDLRLGWSVFSMNPDGSNPVNLTKPIGLDSLASVSRDKTKYLFASNRTGNNEIFLMDVDGSNLVKLTNDPVSDQSPGWSPDGTQIIWNRSRPWRIFVMNSDGSNKRNLGEGYRPAWSPDGRMIGFTLNGVHDNAFLMNADGSGRRQATDEIFPTRFVSWSRDATKIAIGSRGGIYVLNSDGTNPINITIHHAFRWGRGPRWSPDGSKIVYQIQVQIGDRHHGEIYLMNADGSHPVNLTNHPAHDRRAFWIRIESPTTSASPQGNLITT